MQPMTLEELEKKRLAARRSYIFYGILNIAVLATLIVSTLQLGLVVLVLSLVYYFGLARPDIKGFARDFRVSNIMNTLPREMENVVYHGKGGLDRDVLLQDKLLPVKPGKSFLTFHKVTGESRGMKEARKHIAWYIKGMRGASRLKTEIFRIGDYAVMESVLKSYIDDYL